MQTYKYNGISPDGAKVSGIVEGFDRYDALAKINATCSVVTKITEVRKDDINQKLFGNRKIKLKALAMMCSQLSIILKAGMPIVKAIELVANQVEDKSLKRIMIQVAEDVSQGISLSRSLEIKEGVFPITFIETVRSGEKSGTLEKSFAKLHDYYTKTSKLKSKVVSALIYPVFTCIVAVIVIAIIMIVAVPQFSSAFSSLGIELPLPTKIIMAVSDFFVKYSLIVLLIIGLIIFGIKLYQKGEKGRIKISKINLKLPIFGRLAIMKSASQFANTMSTLLAAGLPVIASIGATGKMLDNYYIGSQISSVMPRLEEGSTMIDALKKCEYLPNILVEMVGVGEQTGTLESTLDVIGLYFDNETEVAANRALSLLEPIIIVFLALIIVVVLLSVYMPMFSMYGSMGG